MADLPPQNAIEELLEAGQRGEASREEFVRTLLDWTLIVLADRDPSVTAPAEVLNLMCVSDGANTAQSMVAAFTEGRRAQLFAEDGESRFTAQIPARQLFADVPDGMGMIINPNSGLNFRIAPEVAARLRQICAPQRNEKRRRIRFS